MTRTRTFDITISAPMTLDDLRWLVNECDKLPPDSRVSVAAAKSYSQFDCDPATITVHGT